MQAKLAQHLSPSIGNSKHSGSVLDPIGTPSLQELSQESKNIFKLPVKFYLNH